ncbi:MAG: phospholipase D family protein [Rickettsiaceae bacterium]
MARKRVFKKSQINHFLKFFTFSKSPIRSILVILTLGISLGITYEEMVGIGTWHKFQTDTDKINICFTPPSGCGSLIAQQISQAKESIFVQAYGLTSDMIIYQLKNAHARGVKVRVLLDGGNLSDNKGVFAELKKIGITVLYDKMPGIAHNKVMVIDRKKLITGSFNFTRAADKKNAENVLLIDDRELAKLYIENWKSRALQSKH